MKSKMKSKIKMLILDLSIYLVSIALPLSILSILLMMIAILFPSKLLVLSAAIVSWLTIYATILSGLVVYYYKIEPTMFLFYTIQKILKTLKITNNKRLLLVLNISMIINSVLLAYLAIISSGATIIITTKLGSITMSGITVSEVFIFVLLSLIGAVIGSIIDLILTFYYEKEVK